MTAKKMTERQRILRGTKASWERPRPGFGCCEWSSLGKQGRDEQIADFTAGLVAGGFIKARGKGRVRK